MGESKAAVIAVVIVVALAALGLNYFIAALVGGAFYMVARSKV
jgi:preprotein translocase subunit SecE